MRSATIIGLLAGFAFVALAMVLGGSPTSFVDWPAMLIVIGGTFAVTIASSSPSEVFNAQAVMARSVIDTPTQPSTAAYRMLELAEQARREGLLGLQQRLDRLTDEPFLRKAVSLVIDGTPGEELERLLEREVNAVRQQLQGSAAVFRKAAEVAPAMGLIGTLVGLVQMLSNLEDPASIGPAMAIALLTTFYGAVLAYMVFSPLASKLERDTDEQELVQNVYLLGVASIGRKENPRRLEMQINALLPPTHRVSYFD